MYSSLFALFPLVMWCSSQASVASLETPLRETCCKPACWCPSLAAKVLLAQSIMQIRKGQEGTERERGLPMVLSPATRKF